MSDQKKRIEEAAAWAQTPEGQAALGEARKKLAGYMSGNYAISLEDLYSPLGLEKRGECKNCEQLLARIKELEKYEKILKEIQEIATTPAFKQGAALYKKCAAIQRSIEGKLFETQDSPFHDKQAEPTADPWLGVWRAKKNTSCLIPERNTFDIPKGTIVKVIQKCIYSAVIVHFGTISLGLQNISWLQENFEKVTEAE